MQELSLLADRLELHSSLEHLRVRVELFLAYLNDVEDAQELLAPQTVVFLTKYWRVIGNKGASAGRQPLDLRLKAGFQELQASQKTSSTTTRQALV